MELMTLYIVLARKSKSIKQFNIVNAFKNPNKPETAV